MIRRNPAQDGSFIQDNYRRNDDLTEAPNLRTTETGVKLVSRTIIPPPLIRPRIRRIPVPPPGFIQTPPQRSPPHQRQEERRQRRIQPSDDQDELQPVIEHRVRPFRPFRLHSPSVVTVSDTLSPTLNPTPVDQEKQKEQEIEQALPSPTQGRSDSEVTVEFDPLEFVRENQTKTPLSFPETDISPILPPDQQLKPETQDSPEPLQPAQSSPILEVASTPVNPPVARIAGILRRTNLTDEKGYPIARDSQGRLYRIPPDFSPKIRFNPTPEIKRISPAPEIVSDTPPSSLTQGEPSVQVPVTPAPQETKTRSGRLVKKPDRYGDWDEGTPEEIRITPQEKQKKEDWDEDTKKEDKVPDSTMKQSDSPQMKSGPKINEPEEKQATPPSSPEEEFHSPVDHLPAEASLEHSMQEDQELNVTLEDDQQTLEDTVQENIQKEESFRPVTQPSAFKEYSPARNNTALFLDDSHLSLLDDADTNTRSDLPGIPLDIYNTPESTISKSVQTSATKDNKLIPVVPQPGSAESIKNREKLIEFLKEQDRKANERALIRDIVLSPQKSLEKQNQPSAPTTPQRLYPDLAEVASPQPGVQIPVASTPKQPPPPAPIPNNPPFRPRPDNPIPSAPGPTQRKSRRRPNVQPKPKPDPQQPPPGPPPLRRSSRNARPPQRFGYEDEY